MEVNLGDMESTTGKNKEYLLVVLTRQRANQTHEKSIADGR
jgi:hypothetical protein